MPEIYELWLGGVPANAVEFSRLLLLSAMLGCVTVITNTAIHATGDIRRLSFVGGTMYMLVPVLSWVAYLAGACASVTFAIDLAISALVVGYGFRIMKRQMPEVNVGRYIITVCRSLSVVAISLASLWLVRHLSAL